MSRFFRFSRIRPAELYRERLRQMRRAATLSFALLPGIAALLLLGGRFLPRGAQAASSGDAELRNPTAFAARPAPKPEDASSAEAAAAISSSPSRLPCPLLPDAASPLPPPPATDSGDLTVPLESSLLAERPSLPVENAATAHNENALASELLSTRASASAPPLPDAALADLLSLAPAPAPTESPESESKSAAESSPSRKPESSTSSSSDGRRSRGTSPAADRSPSSRTASTASTDSASSATASSTSATAGGADEAPDTPPRYRKAPPPPYPAAMRAGHYRGEVVVLIEVGADGRPGSVRILRSAGREELDCAARDWILAHWSFYPAVRDGRRVASRVRTSIRFEGR